MKQQFQYEIFPITQDGGSLDALISGDETTIVNIESHIAEAFRECPDADHLEILVFKENR